MLKDLKSLPMYIGCFFVFVMFVASSKLVFKLIFHHWLICQYKRFEKKNKNKNDSNCTLVSANKYSSYTKSSGEIIHLLSQQVLHTNASSQPPPLPLQCQQQQQHRKNFEVIRKVGDHAESHKSSLIYYTGADDNNLSYNNDNVNTHKVHDDKNKEKSNKPHETSIRDVIAKQLTHTPGLQKFVLSSYFIFIVVISIATSFSIIIILGVFFMTHANTKVNVENYVNEELEWRVGRMDTNTSFARALCALGVDDLWRNDIISWRGCGAVNEHKHKRHKHDDVFNGGKSCGGKRNKTINYIFEREVKTVKRSRVVRYKDSFMQNLKNASEKISLLKAEAIINNTTLYKYSLLNDIAHSYFVNKDSFSDMDWLAYPKELHSLSLSSISYFEFMKQAGYRLESIDYSFKTQSEKKVAFADTTGRIFKNSDGSSEPKRSENNGVWEKWKVGRQFKISLLGRVFEYLHELDERYAMFYEGLLPLVGEVVERIVEASGEKDDFDKIGSDDGENNDGDENDDDEDDSDGDNEDGDDDNENGEKEDYDDDGKKADEEEEKKREGDDEGVERKKDISNEVSGAKSGSKVVIGRQGGKKSVRVNNEKINEVGVRQNSNTFIGEAGVAGEKSGRGLAGVDREMFKKWFKKAINGSVGGGDGRNEFPEGDDGPEDCCGDGNDGLSFYTDSIIFIEACEYSPSEQANHQDRNFDKNLKSNNNRGKISIDDDNHRDDAEKIRSKEDFEVNKSDMKLEQIKYKGCIDRVNSEKNNLHAKTNKRRKKKKRCEMIIGENENIVCGTKFFVFSPSFPSFSSSSASFSSPSAFSSSSNKSVPSLSEGFPPTTIIIFAVIIFLLDITIIIMRVTKYFSKMRENLRVNIAISEDLKDKGGGGSGVCVGSCAGKKNGCGGERGCGGGGNVYGCEKRNRMKRVFFYDGFYSTACGDLFDCNKNKTFTGESCECSNCLRHHHLFHHHHLLHHHHHPLHHHPHLHNYYQNQTLSPGCISENVKRHKDKKIGQLHCNLARDKSRKTKQFTDANIGSNSEHKEVDKKMKKSTLNKVKFMNESMSNKENDQGNLCSNDNNDQENYDDNKLNNVTLTLATQSSQNNVVCHIRALPSPARATHETPVAITQTSTKTQLPGKAICSSKYPFKIKKRKKSKFLGGCIKFLGFLCISFDKCIFSLSLLTLLILCFLLFFVFISIEALRSTLQPHRLQAFSTFQ